MFFFKLTYRCAMKVLCLRRIKPAGGKASEIGRLIDKIETL